MRNCILLLFCIWFSHSYAQINEINIASDKTDAKGKRWVSTSVFKCYHGTDGAWYKDANANLLAVIDGGNHTYVLKIQFDTGNPFKTIQVAQRGKLLIKLNNGEILELTNSNKTKGDIGLFLITEEQINAITNGISKMRIETEKKYIDYKFKKNSKFPERLASALVLLQEYMTYGNNNLRTKAPKEDIHKGF